MRIKCRLGNYKIVKLFLNYNPIISNYSDLLPISQACFNGHYKFAKLLLKNGFNVKINEPLVFYAVYNNNYKLVKLFLKHSYDINNMSDHSVYWCARIGYFKILKLLIKYNANIHLRDEEALVFSILSGHIKIEKYLLKYGANNINERVINAKTKTY